MFNLIRRDLILHKKALIWAVIVGPVYLGYVGSRINHIVLLPIFGGLLYAIAPFMLFGREDKFKALTFGLSLPITRREFLRGRYLMSWALMLSMCLAGSMLSILVPGSKMSAATVFGARMILLSLAFMAIVFGVVMPLFLQFGFFGLIALLVGMQVVGVLLMVFRSNAVFDVIKNLFKLIPDGLAAIQASLGPVAASLAVLALLALFSYASFAVSLAVFRRKEF